MVFVFSILVGGGPTSSPNTALVTSMSARASSTSGAMTASIRLLATRSLNSGMICFCTYGFTHVAHARSASSLAANAGSSNHRLASRSMTSTTACVVARAAYATASTHSAANASTPSRVTSPTTSSASFEWYAQNKPCVNALICVASSALARRAHSVHRRRAASGRAYAFFNPDPNVNLDRLIAISARVIARFGSVSSPPRSMMVRRTRDSNAVSPPRPSPSSARVSARSALDHRRVEATHASRNPPVGLDDDVSSHGASKRTFERISLNARVTRQMKARASSAERISSGDSPRRAASARRRRKTSARVASMARSASGSIESLSASVTTPRQKDNAVSYARRSA